MLVYVAGPYRAYGDRTVEQNIAQARKIAIELWKAGHVAICPHLNTANFEEDSGLPDETYLEGDLEILSRCDAIVLTPDWKSSRGATEEAEFAHLHDIPCYTFPDIPRLHSTEVRSPIQCRAMMSVLMKMYRVHLDKNADYSPANILGTGEIGVIVRLWDKIARLLNLSGFRIDARLQSFEAPRQPKHESIEDTLIDAAVYSVIGLLVRRDEWGK